MTEIVPGVGVGTRSETLCVVLKRERTRKLLPDLEVFAIPFFRVWGFLQPLFVFRNGKEIASLVSSRDLLTRFSTLKAGETIKILL